jgi:hypothetical protein
MNGPIYPHGWLNVCSYMSDVYVFWIVCLRIHLWIALGFWLHVANLSATKLQLYTWPCSFSVTVLCVLIFLIRFNFSLPYSVNHFYRLDQQTITFIIMIWEILADRSMFSVGTRRLFHTSNFCPTMNLHRHQQIVHCDYGMWSKTYQWVILTKIVHCLGLIIVQNILHSFCI